MSGERAARRAVIYARYSTELQNGVSIDDQYRVCERIAAAENLSIVGRFEDRGISGGTADRPGYQLLLTLARAGGFDVVICEDLSRLWRSRAEFGSRSAEFEDLGIHLITAAGDSTQRDGWGLVVSIKSALAEYARREISYRTRRGMEGLALAGKPTGGRCYGYRDGAIYEREAGMVRAIFEGRAAGRSLAQLAVETGKPRSSIQAILANRRYTGLVVWGATESKGGARNSRRKRHVKRPDGPLVTRSDESLRIVSDELFNACNPN